MADKDKPVRLGPIYNLPLGEHACVCIRPPFRAAAHFALEWLRGRDLASILEVYEFAGGRPSGIVMRSTVAQGATPGGSGGVRVEVESP